MTVTLDPVQHRYFCDGKPFEGPSVTQALAQSGLVDYSFVDEEIREHAMRRGTSVHWMLALLDQGALEYRKVPKKLRPFRKGYLDWRLASGFTPFRQWIERSFVSPLGFAGTIDRLGDFPWVRGKRTYPAILDIKTGTAVQNWVRYQLVLYGHFAKVYRRIALLLKLDGTYQVTEFPFNSWNTDLAIAMEAVRRWKP